MHLFMSTSILYAVFSVEGRPIRIEADDFLTYNQSDVSMKRTLNEYGNCGQN